MVFVLVAQLLKRMYAWMKVLVVEAKYVLIKGAVSHLASIAVPSNAFW
jgi:hypothetical protein